MTDAFFVKKIKYSLAFLLLLSQSCTKMPPDINEALLEAGKNRIELEKAIRYYQNDGNKMKIEALYYLIKHLPEQYYYEGEIIDAYDHAFNKMDSIISLGNDIDYTATWNKLQPHQKGRLKKVRDIHVITAEFLIENIEQSFRAWQYPWATNLSFDEFCKYILPYKLKNERPENWKNHLQKKYEWIADSLKSDASYFDACILINNEMAKWFYITKLSCPFDLSFGQINKIKSGRCSESTQITAYAMRAMGIPVVLEHVSNWANRNSGHDWNGLIINDKTVPFLGTEINPGLYKIEFAMPGSLRSKRAKVFRWTFENKKTSLANQTIDLTRIPKFFRNSKFQDVTKEYVPIIDVTIQTPAEYSSFKTAYLCVFNNLNWEPIYYGYIKSGQAKFTDMGMGIVYLPAIYNNGKMIPIGSPFILSDNGVVSKINPDKQNVVNISVSKKYPVREDNEIQPNEKYEMFYWDNRWVSLGVKSASGTTVDYSCAPNGALFWVHKIDKGIEERIFTVEQEKQIWW